MVDCVAMATVLLETRAALTLATQRAEAARDYGHRMDALAEERAIALTAAARERDALRKAAATLNLLTVPDVVHRVMQECDWQDYDAVSAILHEARKQAAIDAALAVQT